MQRVAEIFSERSIGRQKGRFDRCGSDPIGKLLEPVLSHAPVNPLFVACDTPSRTFVRRTVPWTTDPTSGPISPHPSLPSLSSSYFLSLYLHRVFPRAFSLLPTNLPHPHIITPICHLVVRLPPCCLSPSRVTLVPLFCAPCTIYYLP
jgi:hypothetical protein